MRKKVTARKSINRARHRTALGKSTKSPTAPKFALPDFEQDASRPGFDAKVGDRLLARLLSD
jgi:hypothetical protein